MAALHVADVPTLTVDELKTALAPYGALRTGTKKALATRLELLVRAKFVHFFPPFAKPRPHSLGHKKNTKKKPQTPPPYINGRSKRTTSSRRA
jgi:hypothetical protein